MKMRLHTRRRGHTDLYINHEIHSGWYVSHFAITVSCDKTGSPFLFKNFGHNSVNYPGELAG